MCAAMGFTACSEDSSGIDVPNVDPPLTNNVTNVTAGGQQAAISLTTQEDWVARSDQDWCIVANATGTAGEQLMVSVMPNFTGKTRTARISLQNLDSNMRALCMARTDTVGGGGGGNNPGTQPSDTTSTTPSDPGTTPSDTTATDPDSQPSQNEYLVVQEADGAPTESAVYITGVQQGENELYVNLRATTDGALYNSVDGLTYLNAPSSDLNIPAEKPVSRTEDTKVCLLGESMDWKAKSSYWLPGNGDDPMCLTLRTVPEAKQKIYISQSETYRLISSELPGSGSSAQVLFRIGDMIYFGGGFSKISRNDYSITTITPSSAFYAFNTRTGDLQQKNGIGEILSASMATTVGQTAYALSPGGGFYSYDAQDDAWTLLHIFSAADNYKALYTVNNRLYTVRASDWKVCEITKTNEEWELSPMVDFPSCNEIVTISESDGRTYLVPDNQLYVHDATGVRQVADNVYDGVMGCYEGSVIYRQDTHTLCRLDVQTGTRSVLPIFNYIKEDKRHEKFHAGRAMMHDGVAYIFMAGNSAYGAYSWNGAQSDDIYRLDIKNFKPYEIEVK